MGDKVLMNFSFEEFSRKFPWFTLGTLSTDLEHSLSTALTYSSSEAIAQSRSIPVLDSRSNNIDGQLIDSIHRIKPAVLSRL
jgi:hypothetical protein